jgi:predicted RNase H-like nuclease
MSWIVVGVDCATQEARTGLAYGHVDDQGQLELKRVTLGTAGESAAATVAGWIASTPHHIVALSAPLGWPLALGSALIAHRAGDALDAPPDQLFRRDTDRFMHAELGKLPPDVGADRIARTARAALDLLQRIRGAARDPLPLAWEPGTSSGVIEVHPAATLLSRGISASGYKVETAAARKARSAILARLMPELHTAIRTELLTEDDDLLDALVCAVAAADFARGHALPPPERARAEREGWIWFRGRGQQKLF